MRSLIAYPDFVDDDAKLDEYYKGLEIEAGDDLYTSFRAVDLWKMKMQFLKLDKLVDRNEFSSSPATESAIYSYPMNRIGELPLFRSSRDFDFL